MNQHLLLSLVLVPGSLWAAAVGAAHGDALQDVAAADAFQGEVDHQEASSRAVGPTLELDRHEEAAVAGAVVVQVESAECHQEGAHWHDCADSAVVDIVATGTAATAIAEAVD